MMIMMNPKFISSANWWREWCYFNDPATR